MRPAESNNQATEVARRPVVYLIAQPTVARFKKPFDITTLYEFGEVQVLCPAGDSPTFTPGKCIDTMEDRFENFDPAVDYLVWAGGDTLAAVMAGMLLAERELYEFNWLRWERDRESGTGRRLDTGKYVAVRVNVYDGEPYAEPEEAVAAAVVTAEGDDNGT